MNRTAILTRPTPHSPGQQNLALFRIYIAYRSLLSVVLLIMLVLGSIYTGVATATESAAFGVIGSFAIALWQRRLTLRNFWDSVMGATRLTSMILLILAAGAVWSWRRFFP